MSASKSKIFGIGLSKTGTTSLARALEILGYKTRDYLGVTRYSSGDLSSIDLDEIETNDAFTDTPVPSFYRELDSRYPGSKFILTSEPDGAGDVIRVREEAGDGDDIVVVGRIGGSSDPWIAGRAAFSIVDGSLKACSDIPGDNCPKPWDYCCETPNLPSAMALVKVVDEQGETVKADAKGLLGVQELSTVVVKGKAKRDDAGNLTILASGIFVKQL